MRVPVGHVSDISDTECIAIGDGRAIIVRVGDEIRAYRNRCLHQDSPLDGGWVRDGVLSCPLHFWRYDVDGGYHHGSSRKLERFPVVVDAGEAFVLLPDEAPAGSLREQLLARARDYDRDTAWRSETSGNSDAER